MVPRAHQPLVDLSALSDLVVLLVPLVPSFLPVPLALPDLPVLLLLGVLAVQFLPVVQYHLSERVSSNPALQQEQCQHSPASLSTTNRCNSLHRRCCTSSQHPTVL